MDERALPFRIRATENAPGLHTVTAAEGLLRLDRDDLVLELRTTTRTFGAVRDEARTGPQEIRIPLDAIDSAEVVGSRFRPRLRIEVNRLAALVTVPGAKGSRCELRIERRDRDRARDIAAGIAIRRADRQLRRLDDGETP